MGYKNSQVIPIIITLLNGLIFLKTGFWVSELNIYVLQAAAINYQGILVLLDVICLEFSSSMHLLSGFFFQYFTLILIFNVDI